jgi:hypothetical protein
MTAARIRRAIARRYHLPWMIICAATGIFLAVRGAPLPWWITDSWICASIAWMQIARSRQRRIELRGETIALKDQTIRCLQESVRILEAQVRDGHVSPWSRGSWN